MNEAHYPIQLVARLTGLSAHVIRIWEQRYRAVEPQRTATNRRLYSQRDIERLNLLRDLTQAGHSIGQVAQLPTDKLGKLVVATPHLQARAPRAAAARRRSRTSAPSPGCSRGTSRARWSPGGSAPAWRSAR